MKHFRATGGICCLSMLLSACGSGTTTTGGTNALPVEEMTASDHAVARHAITAEDASLQVINLALDGIDRATIADLGASKHLQLGSAATSLTTSQSLVIESQSADFDSDGNDDIDISGSGTASTTLAAGAQVSTDIDIDVAWTTTTTSGNYRYRSTISDLQLSWNEDGQPTTCLLAGAILMSASNIQLSSSPDALAASFSGRYELDLSGSVIIDGENVALVIVGDGTFAYNGSTMSSEASYYTRIGTRSYGPFVRSDLIAAPTAAQ